MKLTKQQINALNRSGRAEYDAKLGDLLGEALNKGVGAIIVEADGSEAINDAAEGIPFENIRIIGAGGSHGRKQSISITLSNGRNVQSISINFDFKITFGEMGGVYDEIDLAKGVYIRRLLLDDEVGSVVLPEEEVYSLPDSVIRTYKDLVPYAENMTVTSNSGMVIVNYVADTKKYIDKKVAEIQAIILEG